MSFSHAHKMAEQSKRESEIKLVEVDLDEYLASLSQKKNCVYEWAISRNFELVIYKNQNSEKVESFRGNIKKYCGHNDTFYVDFANQGVRAKFEFFI